MWIMMREGSIRRDLKEILIRVISHGTYTDRLMFCTDGLDPLDLKEYGHIDHCIRESIETGINPIDALSMASKNCFDYYNMGKDLGGIAPGKLADILVFDNLKSFKPRRVFVGGKLVVSNGSIVTKLKRKSIPAWLKKTVKIRKKFSENDFLVKSKLPKVSVNTISMQSEIITEIESVELPTKDGNVLSSRDKDVWKVGAFDRTNGTAKKTIGFLKNFGADIGAFASTWNFHENNLIVIGSSEKDMAKAANSLVTMQGGMVVTKNGKTIASMPLNFGGIISTEPFDKVLIEFSAINDTILDAGFKFKKPHLIPIFLPFLALPSVRILYSGIVDVKKRSYMPVFS